MCLEHGWPRFHPWHCIWSPKNNYWAFPCLTHISPSEKNLLNLVICSLVPSLLSILAAWGQAPECLHLLLQQSNTRPRMYLYPFLFHSIIQNVISLIVYFESWRTIHKCTSMTFNKILEITGKIWAHRKLANKRNYRYRLYLILQCST